MAITPVIHQLSMSKCYACWEDQCTKLESACWCHRLCAEIEVSIVAVSNMIGPLSGHSGQEQQFPIKVIS